MENPPKSQPQDDSVVPWQPTMGMDHFETLQQGVREYPNLATADDVLDAVKKIMNHMACPHADCPLLLLEHHDHQ